MRQLWTPVDGRAPRVQFAAGDANQPARQLQPQRTGIVFDDPVHRIARQTVPAGDRGAMAVLQPDQPVLGGCPKRAARIEAKIVDGRRCHPVRCSIRRADLAVSEMHDPASSKSQPHAAQSHIGEEADRRVIVPESTPGDCLNSARRRDTNETLALVRDPHVPVGVLGNGKRRSPGDAVDTHPSAIFQVTDFRSVRHPETAATVLEQGRPNSAAGLPVSRAIDIDDSDLAVVPPVQAAVGGNPHTAVLRRENRHHAASRQTFMGREACHGILAEAIEPVRGCHPHIALAVFVQRSDSIARETVRLAKDVGPAVVQANEAAPRRSDPQSAVAITKHIVGLCLSDTIRKGNRRSNPVRFRVAGFRRESMMRSAPFSSSMSALDAGGLSWQ